MAEESVTLFLRAQIGEFTGKMKEAGAEVDHLGQKGSSGFQKFQAFGTAALMAVGVAALAVGAYGVKMADEYEKAHARLETAIKNQGGDFEELKGKVGATDKAMESLGFTNADTESSLATLTGVTHSAEKAMSLQTLAADIARGKNIDLATATNALVKVEGGRYTALGKLLGLSKQQVAAIHNEHDATKLLTDLYGGQAKAYTETFAGKVEVLKTKAEDLGKNIGLMLIPVIERLVSTGLSVVTFFQRANEATNGWLGKLALLAIAAPLAVVGILKIVSGVGSVIQAVGAGATAIAGFAETIALFAMLNPELTLLVGLGVAIGGVVAALHIWGGAHDSAKRDTKDFTKALEDDTDALGKNTDAIGANADALIRKQLTDRNQIDDLVRIEDSLHNGESAYQTWTDAVNGSTTAQAQLRRAMLDSGEIQVKNNGLTDLSSQQVRALTADWVKNGGSIDDASRRLKIHNGELALSITGNTGLVASLDQQTVAREGSKRALDDEIHSGLRNRDGTKAQTDETHKNTDATHDNTAALQARTDALNAQRDAVLGMLGADLSMDDALHTLAGDVADYNAKALAVIATHGRDKKATDDLVSSTLQLRHGILDVANSAIADAKAQDARRTAAGQQISAQRIQNDETAAAITALQNMKAQYPGLTALIQGYIDKLNNIPPTKTTVVTTVLQQEAATLGSITGRGSFTGPHAAGGTIGPGEFGTVGEEGTELVEGLPGGGARVLTNDVTRRFLSALNRPALTPDESARGFLGISTPADTSAATRLQRARDIQRQERSLWGSAQTLAQIEAQLARTDRKAVGHATTLAHSGALGSSSTDPFASSTSLPPIQINIRVDGNATGNAREIAAELKKDIPSMIPQIVKGIEKYQLHNSHRSVGGGRAPR